MVLDLGLPEVDGLTVLDRWRREGRRMPVLVLTARDSWSDKVAGLDAGADDYLAKPFQTEELIARLRALIRRASGNASSELNAGDIRLDTRSGKVTKAGEPVKLTAQEYKLLSYLMHHKGKVVSRTELNALQADPPEWLSTLRRNGPHTRQETARRLGISNSGLARGGVGEHLTTEQIKAVLEEMPAWLVAERDIHAQVRAEEARLKARDAERA